MQFMNFEWLRNSDQKRLSIMGSTEKTVSIISTCGVPANYGGYETFVEFLIEKNNNDIDYVVYCSGKRYDERLSYYKGARLFYIPLDANGLQGLVYDSISVLLSWFRSDVILSLGTGGAWLYPILKIFKDTKIISNFDGMDDQREKWNSFQKLVLRINRFFAAKYSDICVADNLVMANLLAQRYGVNCQTITYGADHARRINATDYSRRLGLAGAKYALSVARIVPENNVELTCRAAANSTMKVVVLGNWSSSSYSKNLRKKYQKTPNLLMLDAVYDQNKLDEIRSNCND